MLRLHNPFALAACLVILSLFVLGTTLINGRIDFQRVVAHGELQRTLVPNVVRNSGVPESAEEHSRPFPVVIRKPSGPPRIELVGSDPQGREGSVACSTCHAVRQPNFENVAPSSLDEFHKGMIFNHGDLSCYSCHNPHEADSLRLADGRLVSYENVMTLCSQCHSSQANAFSHGAHGGMNGYWDLTQGQQKKNNCADCHDPHLPAFPKMQVNFKPKDRFNVPYSNTHEH